MMNDNSMWSPDRPWLHSFDIDSTTEIRSALPPAGICVAVRFDGRRLTTAYDLFEQFSSELRFPVYFGWNWSAFSECMRDMSWMPANRYLVVIENAGDVLAEEPTELSTFVRIMSEVGGSWSRRVGLPETEGGKQIAFNTLLLDSADKLGEVRDLLDRSS